MCLTGAALHARPASADPSQYGPGYEGGGGGNGGPVGVGDPDVPDGAGKSRVKSTLALRRAEVGTVAGDGVSSRTEAMWRLYSMWIGLRGYWFRF
jgi:hypothetical protein